MDNYEKAKNEYLSTKKTMRKVCEELKMCRKAFSKKIKQEGILTKRKPDCDESVFETIDSEEKAYWLGFLYADGCVIYNIEKHQYCIELGLAVKDYFHLEKFKKFVKSGKEIKLRESTRSCRIVISSKKMCEDLIKLGCVPKKSLKLEFPKDKIPDEFIKDFVRGYFDGDGSISISKKTNSFQVNLIGTIEFVSSLREIYPAKHLLKDKRHLGNTFSLRFNSLESFYLMHNMYSNSTISLDRKIEKYNYLLTCRSGKKFLELLESKYGEGCDS